MEWWRNGALQNTNSNQEISGFQVSGVRCQERKTKKLKPETSVKDQIFDVE